MARYYQKEGGVYDVSKDKILDQPEAERIRGLSTSALPQYIKNKQYDPNDVDSKRYVPSGEQLAGLIQPAGDSQVIQPSGEVKTTPEGIGAVFGAGWQPADIFKERGLTERGIKGAVRVKGAQDVFTIGERGKWIETPEEYEELFGTREQAGIVGEITPEEAKLLGVRPEGVAELKATRQRDVEKKELFDLAQKAGLTWEETMDLVSAQYPTDTKAIEEELGIPDVVEKLFQMPDKTTQEIYQEAYSQSELPDLKNKVKAIDDKIASRESDLVKATGALNMNPWISQATRTGRLRILNELASADINNLNKQRNSYLDLYDKGLDELEGVMLRGEEQYEKRRTLQAEQLNYLLGEAERRATEEEEAMIGEGLRYMPEWLRARAEEGVKDKDWDKLLSPNEAAALGVEYGTTKGEAAEMGLAPKEKLTGTQKIDMEVKLANNFERYVKEARQSVRGIDIIKTGYDEAMNAINVGGSLNAPSQAMLVTFQKMLDPTSVVRESEYARSGAGLSLKNQILGKYEKLMRGGAGVTVKDLKEFRDISVELAKVYEGEMMNYAGRTQVQAENYGLNLENILTPDILSELEEKKEEGGDDPMKLFSSTAGMRTDRHNNPTAFTTDIAKMALKKGVDYIEGDPFPNNPKLKTARLLGDPVKQTIKVIDKIGFYTKGGKQRWTHTAMSTTNWNKMSYAEKKNVIKKMYQKEGNKGILNNYFA